MDNKEIILSRIAEILSRKGFFLKKNSEFKSRLKCVGLGEYFDKYADYLIPYEYGKYERALGMTKNKIDQLKNY